jgi:hypothetical protein
METTFTKKAGLAGMWAAGLMILTPSVLVFGHWVDDRNGPFVDSETAPWLVLTAALMGALALTVVLMMGLWRLHDGLGVPGVVGIVLVGLATAASVLAWAFPLWGGLLAAGGLMFAAAMWNRGIVPKAASLALGGGMIIGIGTFAALTVFEVGWRDFYGDYPAAWMTGIWVGMVITAAGAYGLGRFLRTEEAVELAPTDHAITA